MQWFATRLLAWFDRHGRRDLPWQNPLTPYRVWVSEIMLQQTQVATVIPYYQRFVTRFPDVAALAAAPLDDVLHHWTGLGYYARARNLHSAACTLMRDHGGQLPADPQQLCALPGIGRSTAGAICAIAHGRRAAILDGNVKRVLARYHAVPGYPGASGPQRLLWQHAESHTPAQRVGDYTQAIMDLGATLCTRTRPGCPSCPVAERCEAHGQGTTHLYPTRKPVRAKPVRSARMFLILDPARRCLLEQRPPAGLWGGLWTPPERASATSPAEVCNELGIPPALVAHARSGSAFRHTFSHFHLDIEPVHVQLNAAPSQALDRPDLCWYDTAPDARQRAVGLAAPAAKLLSAIAAHTSMQEEFSLR